MFNFINYVRVIATILITNSHFNEIWPISSLAAGGLLGNVLFFAVSGFCLYAIKDNFLKWISKRFLRIYPALVFVTLITVLLGFYKLQSWADVVYLFVYPTNYVFIVWLIVCYVLFYLFAFLDKKYNKTLDICFIGVIILWLATYLIFIDKSNYVVDNVENPFIIFLYFTSMILGAMFKKHYEKFTSFKLSKVLLLGASVVVYFASKIIFSRWEVFAPLQIFNQFIILAVLYFTFSVFIGLEEKLSKVSKKLNKSIKFLGGLTLQIYLVQFVIIRQFKTLVFPLNLIVVVCCILAFATLVYLVEFFIRKTVLLIKNKSKTKRVEND